MAYLTFFGEQITDNSFILDTILGISLEDVVVREQQTHWQSALLLKISGFIRSFVNLGKMNLIVYEEVSPFLS